MNLREWNQWVDTQKNRISETISKRHFFLIEKYIEDVRQDEKHVPDLLEAIMRLTCLVKEVLRQILFKMIQFEPEITKSGFDPKVKSPKMGLPMDPRQFLKRPTLFRDVCLARGQIFRKIRVLARGALTLVWVWRMV